jgi:L-malate glycosyltransferase
MCNYAFLSTIFLFYNIIYIFKERLTYHLERLISRLRYIEYFHRSERLLKYGRPQKLVKKKKQLKNNKIHIVYVLNHVGVCGGVKVILEHANGLKRLGARVTLVSHFPKPDWYPVEVDYIQVPFQIEVTRGIPNCDIIVATYWDHIHACIETGIAPVVYFEQGDFHLFEWKSLNDNMKKIVTKQFSLTNQIITVSHQVATIIKEKFKCDAQVFHNALNSSVFFPKTRIPEKKYMLIVGSEQTAFKGIPDLHKVFHIVKSRGYDLELIWITPTKPVNPIGQVFINPPQSIIGDLYRKASVFVSASRYESFSLPPLEAMACGTPVVAVENVGVKEYAKDGYNCLMTKSGDIEGLAERIIQLLDNQELYNRLVQNGYETAKKFQWEQTLKRLFDYYVDLALYEPEQINELDCWSKSFREEELENPSDSVLIEKFLSQTQADQILFPVQYDIIPGHPIVIWEPLIKRKGKLNNNFSEKLLFKIKKRSVPTEWIFKDIAELYINGQFVEAIDYLMKMLSNTSKNNVEQAICIRWIILCLIELDMYAQALSLIEDTRKEHPLYTDLIYLEAVIQYIKGNKELANTLLYQCAILGEAIFYPEHFADIKKFI